MSTVWHLLANQQVFSFLEIASVVKIIFLILRNFQQDFYYILQNKLKLRFTGKS